MMQSYILFALLLITESTPVQKREVTWTAEFSSQQTSSRLGPGTEVQY
jgi:hypothetical protein